MPAEYYFHYTSLVAAQMIIAVGSLEPRRGCIYLSEELFASGAAAARILGIPVVGPSITGPLGLTNLTKPVEIVCCIPADYIDATMLEGPEPAEPFRDWGTGAIVYSGGGRQYRYRGELEVTGLPWLTLGRP